jgi:hypothetical protein
MGIIRDGAMTPEWVSDLSLSFLKVRNNPM